MHLHMESRNIAIWAIAEGALSASSSSTAGGGATAGATWLTGAGPAGGGALLRHAVNTQITSNTLLTCIPSL